MSIGGYCGVTWQWPTDIVQAGSLCMSAELLEIRWKQQFTSRCQCVIGVNFHSAMVATAPGEKLLIGRRPVRNWTQLQFFLFHCELRAIIYRFHWCHDLQSAVSKPTVAYLLYLLTLLIPYDRPIKLVFVQRITLVLRKINKNCCYQSCTLLCCHLNRPGPYALSVG